MYHRFSSKEERNRHHHLTSLISVSCAIIFIVVGILYYLFKIEETYNLTLKLFLSTPLFIVSYLLNRHNHSVAARLLLCAVIPILVMYFSIDSKLQVIDHNIINPVNYFDVRIAMINVLVIPLVLFPLRSGIWMAMAILPSAMSLAFFDPVHNYFGVGYYQSGMQSPDYYISANMYTYMTVMFLTTVILYLKRLVGRSEKRQETENDRMKLFLESLVTLSQSQNINGGNPEATKKELLLAAYETLNIHRASLWNFDPQQGTITCELVYAGRKFKNPHTQLNTKDYPEYFKAMRIQEPIIAHDAYEHPATKEFAEHYLDTFNIRSKMDAPFVVNGEHFGIISLEQQGEPRKWDLSESLYLKALADFMSYASVINELSFMNRQLETKVAKRTDELKFKNEQLTEYAYINSHILRAPVARISGLYNIFKSEASELLNDNVILEYMQSSIQELEQVTREINRSIEDNGSIKRESISDTGSKA